MKKVALMAVIFSSFFNSASAEDKLPCEGKWTVTGGQKRILNGSEKASIVSIAKWSDYSYGSFYSKFLVKEFPVDIPRTHSPHTLTCVGEVLYLEWVSRRTGEVKKVFFERLKEQL